MAANVNNYIAAGRAAVNANNEIRAALAKGKPQVDKIGNAAITANAREKAQAMKNNRAVAGAAMDNIAKNTNVQREIDSDKKIRGYKKNARMAGMLAGGAALIGVGAINMNKKEEENELLGLYKQYADKYSDTTSIDGEISAAQAHLDGLKGKGSDASQTTGDTVGQNTGSQSIQRTGTKPAGGNATGVRLAKDLMSQGYSKIQAAAIAGNAQHESANFTAHEEFSPNSYGTKGAGFFQWTNTNTPRRSQFESYAKSKGLDPTSYEASTGYMTHEMNITGEGSHWTGSGRDGFMNSGDLTSATTSFMNNYLRPHKDHLHTDRRVSNAQSIFSALD